MQETLKKAGFFFQNHPKATLCVRLKIWQVLLQSILALVTGILSVSSPGSCSSPLNVFLLGLFGIYIVGLSLNFFVCCGRCCENFGIEKCRHPFNLCMRGINYLYLPLYWAFCAIEFIWYILGAYWASNKGDCGNAYSTGYQATIGLIAFYFVLLLIYILCFSGFICYVKFNDIPAPKPPEKNDPNLPVPADNTAGNFPPGYYNNDPRYNQGHGFPPPEYQNDPRYNQGHGFPPPENQNNPGGFYNNRPPEYGNTVVNYSGYPNQNDPRYIQQDPRAQTGYNEPYRDQRNLENQEHFSNTGNPGYPNHPLAPQSYNTDQQFSPQRNNGYR